MRVADQIYGALFGAALGDALGLYTEMIPKAQAQEMWTRLGGLGFQHWEERDHTRQFQRGDWTDDTDLAITIVDSFLANAGKVNLLDMQQRAANWLANGFPELGDSCGLGTGSTITTSLTDPTVSLGPKIPALLTWAELGQFDLGTSGAVMRIAPVGSFLYEDQAALREAAISIGAITHADPRSVAACVSIVTAIRELLHGQSAAEAIRLAEESGLEALQTYTASLPREIQAAAEIMTAAGLQLRAERLVSSFQAAYPAIQSRASAELFQACFRYPSLAAIPEICTFSRDYAYKILGIAMWALRQERSYEEVILDIVSEGGDADTNAAVAGAVYGAKVGLSALPERLLAGLLHRDWLHAKATQAVKLIVPSYA